MGSVMRNHHSIALRAHGYQPTLFGGIIFVDWHGVLSSKTFWHSILSNPHHPYNQEIRLLHRRLFSSDDVIGAWMRGQVEVEDVLAPLSDDLKFDRRTKPGFALRRLLRDYRAHPLNTQVIRALEAVAPYYQIVVATDNMDCVVDSIALHPGVKRFAQDIISSSDMGVLKEESPAEFFGPWLYGLGLDFEDSVLVDDSIGNCRAFESAGGRSIHVRDLDDASLRISELIPEQFRTSSVN